MPTLRKLSAEEIAQINVQVSGGDKSVRANQAGEIYSHGSTQYKDGSEMKPTTSWLSNVATISLEDLLQDAQSGFASGERAPKGIIQVRMNNVSTEGQLSLADVLRVPATRQQIQKYSLLPGDVLFNSTNSPELVGKTAVFNGHSEPVVFSNHFVRLRVGTKRLDSHYLANWFTYQWKQRIFEGLCTQWVNQAAVRKEDLLSLAIPLPPLPEQRRIAAILARADRLRRLHRTALQLGESYLQSVFVQIFGELIQNTYNWNFVELAEISDITSGVTKGQRFNGKQTVEVPYLRVANVQDGFLNLSEVKTIRALPADVDALRLQKDDIVMTEGGDFDKLGRGAIWHGEIDPCIHQNHIFRVRLDRTQTIPEFFASFLLTPHTKDYFLKASKQTTNLATINMTQLKALPVPRPPLPLQQRFAAIAARYERLRIQQREALRQAEHLFDTLLHLAFRGELGEGAMEEVANGVAPTPASGELNGDMVQARMGLE